jgi:hypothetical protein
MAEDVLLGVSGVPLKAFDVGEERGEVEHTSSICWTYTNRKHAHGYPGCV